MIKPEKIKFKTVSNTFISVIKAHFNVYIFKKNDKKNAFQSKRQEFFYM